MSSGLLGPDGKPISSKTYNKKVAPPKTGEQYGAWGGPSVSLINFPGGGAIQFDLDQLTLGDFRQMRDHYQINNSLAVLMFLLHQLEWRIQVSDSKQRDFYAEQVHNMWTPLVRAKSQAFWSGFSPNVVQWENDVASRRVIITKIKDLVPEESQVNWKTVDGAGTHKISVYDGIKNWGQAKPIPVENTYWYPLLMENGNYQGRKLLRSAFQPWFFSLLLHLFANRYYERFGEPTPVGRAPYDDDIRYNGTEMRGNQAMELLLGQIRNRSVVVLPNDKTQHGDETQLDYDYQIEYLESQMRGADFERYMTRLDEEMSLALFTPILLMRTADVGSYNLGTQHNLMYQWLLNAIAGDWKYYIDWYLLRPLRDYNFGTNAELPRIEFRRLGARNEEMVMQLVSTLIGGGKLKADIEELGQIAGLDLSEVRELTTPPDAPEGDGGDPSSDPATGGDATENRTSVYRVIDQLSERIRDQVTNRLARGDWDNASFSWGYQSKFVAALRKAGVEYAEDRTKQFYDALQAWADDMVSLKYYRTSESFMRGFEDMAKTLANNILGSQS